MSAPKDPRERARRNVRPSAATLEGNFVDLTDGPPPIGPPPTGQKWHRQVRMWWDSVWVNPFASQYLESDLGELRAVGLSDRDILDLTMIVGYFNFVNRIAVGLGVEFSEDEVRGYLNDCRHDLPADLVALPPADAGCRRACRPDTA